MGDLIRRIFGLPTKADSRAQAERERLAREHRDIRMSCRHYCASCDYFSRVYEITASDALRRDTAWLKADHVADCRAGVPDSSSCIRFIGRN